MFILSSILTAGKQRVTLFTLQSHLPGMCKCMCLTSRHIALLDDITFRCRKKSGQFQRPNIFLPEPSALTFLVCQHSDIIEMNEGAAFFFHTVLSTV